MKGDFSRNTFQPDKHYRSVRLQQGRVQIDSDWNEQTQIDGHLRAIGRQDIIGACGAPDGNAAFVLSSIAGGADLAISPGRAYVNGRTVELDAEWVEVVAIPAADHVELASLQLDGRVPAAGQWLEIAGATAAVTVQVVDCAERLVRVAGNVAKLGSGARARRVTTYLTQPDLPDPRPVPDGRYLAYLDVWERHITGHEDPEILEPGLGGPDTATRTRIVWQLQLEPIGAGLDCEDFAPGWSPPGSQSRAALRARAAPSASTDGDRIEPPGSGYTRLENQLYRIEVHRGGSAGTATFKWSRDNGSVVYPIVQMAGDVVTVADLGRDTALRPGDGDIVEIVDDSSALGSVPAHLAMITVDEASRQLTLDDAPAGPLGGDASRHPLIRRWNHHQGDGMAMDNHAVVIEEGRWLELESGVEIQFGVGGSYRAGDYWQIPARVNVGVLWPGDSTDARFLQPRGVDRNFCAVAVVDGTQVTSLLRRFPSLTDIKAADVGYRAPDDCSELSEVSTVQEAIDELCRRLRHDGPNDVISQVARLGDLRAAGILTDEEFESKKGELLDRI